MWSIHYGLHIPITHSFLKRKSWMCSKVHQIFSKTSQWLYVPDKMLINWTTTYETWILFSKQRGENKNTRPMFDNKFLAYLKPIKLCTRDSIFPIKQEDICDYNPLCFISSGLMIDDIIMNLFTDSTEQTMESYQKLFFQNPGWYHSLVRRISAGFYMEKKKIWQKKHYVCIITLKEKN